MASALMSWHAACDTILKCTAHANHAFRRARDFFVAHVTPLTSASQLSYRVCAKAGTVTSAWVVSAAVNVAAIPAKPMINSATEATTNVAAWLATRNSVVGCRDG